MGSLLPGPSPSAMVEFWGCLLSMMAGSYVQGFVTRSFISYFMLSNQKSFFSLFSSVHVLCSRMTEVQARAGACKRSPMREAPFSKLSRTGGSLVHPERSQGGCRPLGVSLRLETRYQEAKFFFVLKCEGDGLGGIYEARA